MRIGSVGQVFLIDLLLSGGDLRGASMLTVLYLLAHVGGDIDYV
jgi:hypothetical protein